MIDEELQMNWFHVSRKNGTDFHFWVILVHMEGVRSEIDNSF